MAVKKKEGQAAKFLGADVMTSARWREFRDLLGLIVAADEFYTAAQVDAALAEILAAAEQKDINKEA